MAAESSATQSGLLTPNPRAATLPRVTADPTAMAASDALPETADSEDEYRPLYCYRHPKSETYVRCGRCDQPICPKCAVQGPVGFRCRQCGLVKSATLSSFTPRQLALGIGVSLGGGAILGYLGGQVGFYSIFISFFAGGFIAEAMVRMTGMKRGPVMAAMLYGGLLAGFAIGATVQIATLLGSMPAEAGVPIAVYLQGMLPFVLISAGAAVAGAYSRVRFF
jgi:hypothetical protein